MEQRGLARKLRGGAQAFDPRPRRRGAGKLVELYDFQARSILTVADKCLPAYETAQPSTHKHGFNSIVGGSSAQSLSLLALRPPMRRQEYLTGITICSTVSLSTVQNVPTQRPIRGNTFEAPIFLRPPSPFQIVPQSHRNFPYILIARFYVNQYWSGLAAYAGLCDLDPHG
jgi:hypothetical protein